MKTAGIAGLLCALLAVTFATPADAARSPRKATREAVATYDAPTLGSASGTGGAVCFPCPAFPIYKAERFVRMEVRDDASLAPVAFDIRQVRPDGRCCDEVAGPFCGSTGEQPVPITPGLAVHVFVFASGDAACPGAFGTRGTATALFSNVS